jgi:hypothetical protein
MLRTPKRAAISGTRSVSSLARRAAGSRSRAAASNSGAIARHGPHQAAQKSTSTGTSVFPIIRSKSSAVPSSTGLPSNSGAWHHAVGQMTGDQPRLRGLVEVAAVRTDDHDAFFQNSLHREGRVGAPADKSSAGHLIIRMDDEQSHGTADGFPFRTAKTARFRDAASGRSPGQIRGFTSTQWRRRRSS